MFARMFFLIPVTQETSAPIGNRVRSWNDPQNVRSVRWVVVRRPFKEPVADGDRAFVVNLFKCWVIQPFAVPGVTGIDENVVFE